MVTSELLILFFMVCESLIVGLSRLPDDGVCIIGLWSHDDA